MSTRRQILGLLLAPKTMQEVAELLPVMPNVTRKHMKELREDGLIADAGPHAKFTYARLYLITQAGKDELAGVEPKPWYQTVSKTCVICQDVFSPSKHVSRKLWDKTRTCGKPDCVKQVQKKPRPERRKGRTCENCGAMFYFQKVDGVWRTRKTCKDQCAKELKIMKLKKSLMHGPAKPKNISTPVRLKGKMAGPVREPRKIAPPEVTVAECLTKIEEKRRKQESLTIQAEGNLCACGNAGASPYTGVCSSCYVKRNWQQGSHETKVKPRMEYRAGTG